MELLLIQKLEELGLMFGYPDEAPDRTPLEVDTDTLYSNILQSIRRRDAEAAEWHVPQHRPRARQHPGTREQPVVGAR